MKNIPATAVCIRKHRTQRTVMYLEFKAKATCKLIQKFWCFSKQMCADLSAPRRGMTDCSTKYATDKKSAKLIKTLIIYRTARANFAMKQTFSPGRPMAPRGPGGPSMRPAVTPFSSKNTDLPFSPGSPFSPCRRCISINLLHIVTNISY